MDKNWQEISLIEAKYFTQSGKFLCIPFPCGSYATSFMEDLREADLGWNLIGLVTTHAQQFSCRCMSTDAVTRLNHEIFDNPMEQHSVVKTLLHEFHNIITMERRLVIEHNRHITAIRFQNDSLGFLLLSHHWNRQQEEESP